MLFRSSGRSGCRVPVAGGASSGVVVPSHPRLWLRLILVDSIEGRGSLYVQKHRLAHIDLRFLAVNGQKGHFCTFVGFWCRYFWFRLPCLLRFGPIS